MEYYSAIKKNEILPFVTTWMKIEGITLSEISQTNIVWYHLCVESKRAELVETRDLFLSKRADLKCFHHQKEMVIMWYEGGVS